MNEGRARAGGFFVAEQGQGQASSVLASPKRFGDVGGSAQTQQVDGEVAKGCHHAGAVSFADLEAILVEEEKART